MKFKFIDDHISCTMLLISLVIHPCNLAKYAMNTCTITFSHMNCMMQKLYKYKQINAYNILNLCYYFAKDSPHNKQNTIKSNLKQNTFSKFSDVYKQHNTLLNLSEL